MVVTLETPLNADWQGSILLALIWYRLGLSSMHLAVNARCISAGNSGNIASFGFARHRGLLRCTGAPAVTAAVACSRSQCRARMLVSRAHGVGSDGVPTAPGPKTRRRRQLKQCELSCSCCCSGASRASCCCPRLISSLALRPLQQLLGSQPANCTSV